jgi:hypothetical protein
VALSVDLPVPVRGVAQVRLLDFEWTLEARPDGLRCMAVADRVRFDGWLGVPAGTACLHVSALPPRFRVEVELESDLVLVPGGAIRGWFDVPLRQRLWMRGGNGAEHELCVVEDPELRTGWREGEGYYHPWRSAWTSRPGVPPVPARLWLRARAVNMGPAVARPRQLRLDLAGRELHLLRGLAIGPGIVWRLGREEEVELRRLPRIAARRPRAAVRESEGHRRFEEAAS